MMYGFGDDPNPRQESVDLIEDLVMEYIVQLCQEALNTANVSGSKVKIEDFLFVLRKDEKKLRRAEELLYRFDELQRARKAFDTTGENF
jgi:transcription initiation factor TFIID subunit 13